MDDRSFRLGDHGRYPAKLIRCKYSADRSAQMFQCHSCSTTVFTSECPICGFAPDNPNTVDDNFRGIDVNYRRRRPEPEPPLPYRQRLAQFCDCDESDVMQNRPNTSSMPLRILTSIGPYIGPKSSKLIQYLLHRIRYLVGRSEAGRGGRRQ